MKQINLPASSKIKYLTRDQLYAQLKALTSSMMVTAGSFEHIAEDCQLEDVEWNHMDQMHRLSIHNTYEKSVRIACGSDFAVSLTKWSKWPFMITVSDVYVEKGLFYQTLTIAGIIVIHSIISLEQINESVKLKHEWFIASHRFFKLVHGVLNRKLYKLNLRLQEEDTPVRQGRLVLRKQGYSFKTDKPNYLNSNLLGQHTIYPPLAAGAIIGVDQAGEQPRLVTAGNIDYLIKQHGNSYHIWPAVCPHEGGSLAQGKMCEGKITCPWHGLKFSAAVVSLDKPTATKYGFDYELIGDQIHVRQCSVVELQCRIAAENESVVL